MAKYLALRRYAADYACMNCGSQSCNPTRWYLSLLFGTSGYRTACQMCYPAPQGLPRCPDCRCAIQPYKQASTQVVGVTAGHRWELWSAECSQTCSGRRAAGLGAAAALPGKAPTTSSSAPAPQASAPPSGNPYAGSDAQKRYHLRNKLTERVHAALASSLAQGHLMPRVLVFDLDAHEKEMKLTCSDCQGWVVIPLAEFPKDNAMGTALTFSCERLKRGKKA